MLKVFLNLMLEEQELGIFIYHKSLPADDSRSILGNRDSVLHGKKNLSRRNADPRTQNLGWTLTSAIECVENKATCSISRSTVAVHQTNAISNVALLSLSAERFT